MVRRREPFISEALLDQLLAGADPKTAFDPNGLPDGLKKALAERVPGAEMDQHLAGDSGNSRESYGAKTVLADTGRMAARRSSGCGWSRTDARSSGCGC